MNYAKIDNVIYRAETLAILKSYENRGAVNVVRYSFAEKFAERRSKNLLYSFGLELLKDNSREMVAGIVQALFKMVVLDFNDGNISFE